nr:hypothetical protein [Tanacetum cinerariifolium]
MSMNPLKDYETRAQTLINHARGLIDYESLTATHVSNGGTASELDEKTSATREYPSMINTFFLTHTVSGVFLNPEDKGLYDEMLRLQGLGSNTPIGVPYTEDEIMAIVRGASSGGTFSVLDGFCRDRARSILPHLKLELQPEYGGGSESDGCGDDEPGDDEDGGEDEDDT